MLGWAAAPAMAAKAPDLFAIEIYQDASGPAYVEISNATLNVKNEVHLCEGTGPISKSGYSKLQKLVLAPGMSLERTKDGVLWLTRPGGRAECIVPANLKDFDRHETATPSELADKTELQGNAVSRSAANQADIPPIVAGTKLVLLSGPDHELAEYLLADNTGTIAGWQRYIDKFHTGPHVNQALAAQAALYIGAGRAMLTKYQAAPAGAAPAYDLLVGARKMLDQGLMLGLSSPASEDLKAGIHQEAQTLNRKGLDQLAQFRAALKSGTAGYGHLPAAEDILAHTSAIDPTGTETAQLREEDAAARGLLDHRFTAFENDLGSRNPEDAYEEIRPLRAFAPELPKVQECFDRLYEYYAAEGKKDGDKNDPLDQVEAYRKALEVEPKPEMGAMLKAAEQSAQKYTDQKAILYALTLSSGFEDDKRFVEAYEVLAKLTPAQQTDKNVAEQLEALKKNYLQKAPAMAAELQRQNTPVDSLSKEVALDQAYSILTHCYALNNNPSTKDDIHLLAESLSQYDLDQAKLYLDKQDESSNLGWAYLEKASHYKVVDEEALQGKIKEISMTHQAGRNPSLSIRFEDADAPGAGDFPRQLARATAASIATYNSKLKIAGDGVKPAFVISGEATVKKVSNVESVPRTSTRNTSEIIDTDEYKAAKRRYENAKKASEIETTALQQALDRKNKKELNLEATRKVEADNALMQAQEKLAATPRTREAPATASYNYTEKVDHLTVTVQLRFQIQDSAGKTILNGTPVSKTGEAQIKTLVGVLPGDPSVQPEAGGVTEPELIEEVEAQARDALLPEVRKALADLPKTILASADQRASANDTPGAAALYMLYLDSTPPQPSPDWVKAQRYLSDNYNFQGYGDTPQA